MAEYQANNKSVVLFVATVSSFIGSFMTSSVNVALPSIQEQFSMNAVSLSWVQTSFLLAAAVSMVPLGRFSDIHGRKLAFGWGMILMTVGSFFCGISGSPFMIIASRVGQGVGSALVFATSLAIVTSVFSLGERGRAIGFTVGAVYTGLTAGPVIGGFLTQHLGWRSVFLVNVPLSLATVPLIFFSIKGEWADAKGEHFDLTGSLLYGVALIAFIYGLSLLPDLTSLWLVFLGLAGLTAFVILESRIKTPVFQVNLFRSNKIFAFSNLAALVNYSATFGVTFMISLYLQYIKGLSPQHAGLILVAQPLVMAVGSPMAGRLSDRLEPRHVAAAGMAFTTVGLLVFTSLDLNTSIVMVVGNLLLIGLGFALFSSPNTNAIMSSVDKRLIGVASGTVSTMRLIGQMLSMGIATVLFAVLIGRVEIAQQNYPQFMRAVKIAFLIFGVICALGVWASLTGGTVKQALNHDAES